MIRINLLKNLSAPPVRALDLAPPPAGKKPLLVGVLAVAVVAGAFFLFKDQILEPIRYSMGRAKTESPKPKAAAKPAPPAVKPPAAPTVAEAPKPETPPAPAAPATPIAPAAEAPPPSAPASHTREAPSAVASAPSAPAAPAPPASVTKATAAAVQAIVSEVKAERQSGKAPPTYAGLQPGEKIRYQYAACTQALKRIRESAPPQVGLAHFIFSQPGDFYLLGLAYDPHDVEKFRTDLAASQGASVKPGILKATGAGGRAQAFSFSGSLRVPVEAAAQAARTAGAGPGAEAVKAGALGAEFGQLRSIAASLGLKVPMPKLEFSSPAGGYKQQVYKTEVKCSYNQLQDLLTRLEASHSNLGPLKLALRADGDEEVLASLDLLVFVD